MELKGLSALIFSFSLAFAEKMIEQGYEDPRKRKQFFFNRASTHNASNYNYSSSIDINRYHELEKEYEGKSLSPDRKYISLEDWDKQETEYIAKSVLLADSYDNFEKYVISKNAEYLLDKYTPCQDPTHQCSMFCHKWKGDNLCHN